MPGQSHGALLPLFRLPPGNCLPSSAWPHASPRTSQGPAIVGAEAKRPERPSLPLCALLVEGPGEEGCLPKVRGEMSES